MHTAYFCVGLRMAWDGLKGLRAGFLIGRQSPLKAEIEERIEALRGEELARKEAADLSAAIRRSPNAGESPSAVSCDLGGVPPKRKSRRI